MMTTIPPNMRTVPRRNASRMSGAGTWLAAISAAARNNIVTISHAMAK
jgi:hypothetical protein